MKYLILGLLLTSCITVPNIWLCGNHKNPRHSATSFEEMKESTLKYNYKGWHRSK